MLKKHGELFKNFLFILDAFVIIVSWLLAYYVRFYSGLVPVYHDVPSIESYTYLILPIVTIWAFMFSVFNLYRPRRTSSRIGEIIEIVKAYTLAVLILIVIVFFLHMFELSRLTFICFWLFGIIGLCLSRGFFRSVLRLMRAKGYNLRHVIIVGDGKVAEELIEKLSEHPELGINIVGLLSSETEMIGKRIYGTEIIGLYSDIERLLEEKSIDQVFLALPFSEITEAEQILKSIESMPVTVKLVMDIQHFLPFCGDVEEFNGLPILSIRSSRLHGWSIILKRFSDVFVSVLAVILAAPLMVFISIIIKLTSPGPILYRQNRAGPGGECFDMFKFRSMRDDAEKETGAVWAKENDNRRTRFGSFLRRTSLDELPQFFNVIMGDMSVVGPRPERPEFIEEFKKDVPRYMLRSMMRSGITGWAQVNGWRGDTSISKRLEFDLYYIENWSLSMDYKIMLLTIWKGFINKNAY